MSKSQPLQLGTVYEWGWSRHACTAIETQPEDILGSWMSRLLLVQYEGQDETSDQDAQEEVPF